MFQKREMQTLKDLSDDDLQKLMDTSGSYSQLLRRLHICDNKRPREELKRRMAILNTKAFDENRKKSGRNGPGLVTKKPLESLLVIGSNVQSNKLKKKLFAAGLKQNLCDGCGIGPYWKIKGVAKPIALQLEHKNGDNCDNRLENLEILCPNCHATTDTYCGKNRKAAKEDAAEKSN